jgi:hypothetical protein
MTREYTRKLFDAVEEGLISPSAVVDMCLAYMSEDDVKLMCESNSLFEEEEEDD